MRMILTTAFAAGLLAAALPAQAANSTTNGARNDSHEQNQTARSNDPDRQICVHEQRSESRLNHPICHTAREWRDLEGGVPSEHGDD